ncbi:MAG TPA: DUF4124 domain-containing protein [Gammaproteobacteria bacterium]|nr:DUF4124 domain-containing protein [Gammaproteobacteria bacterium]
MQRQNELPAQLGGYKFMLRLLTVYAWALLACGNWPGANAATIHKWVDDRGTTHYSDTAPSAPLTSVTRLEISTGDTAKTALSPTSDHYYSIANQWQRLQQERLQQQQLELQKAAINADRSAVPEHAENSDESHTDRYPVAYPIRFHRRHGYPRHHPRPRRDHGYAHQAQRNSIRASGLPIMN